MAAFHPATVRLLRRNLADLATQHKQDLARLARLKVESKSQMAQKLRDRIASSVLVMRDLETLAPSDVCPPQTELQTAYRVLGQLMEQMPSDFEMCGWHIMQSHSGTRIEIQQSARPDLAKAGIRQQIKSVATVLGLTYSEENSYGSITVQAVGAIDGIDIQVWDLIEGGEPA